MDSREEQVRAVIAEQAGDWFVTNEDQPLSQAECSALADWLKTSPVHIEEFLAVSVIARDLAIAADDPEVSLESLIGEARSDTTDNVVALGPVGRAPRRFDAGFQLTCAWTRAASIAAAVVLIVFSVVWWAHDGELLGLPKTYETEPGEQAAWRLPDGSMLHLNTDSQAAVRFFSTERVVDVARGEAFFEVTHGDRRRFRVSAGEAQVLAVGTKFDVYRHHNTTLVTVVEGAVDVSTGESPPLIDTAASVPSLRVAAGQQGGVESGTLWGGSRPVDATVAVAWLHHQIIVQDQPLGEVAAEFNRYGRVHVEIDEPTLRALRVSGRFDAYDTESFAAFLASLDGVAVEKSTTQIRVIRLPAERSELAPDAR